MKSTDKTLAAELAKAITVLCVRNGFLEDLHSGTTPSSQTGDYSDVTVVTPYGEIPWPHVSRISDEEMKRLMKEIVNHVYTFLCRQDDPAFVEAFLALGARYTGRWDAPEWVEGFVVPVEPARTKTGSYPRAESPIAARSHQEPHVIHAPAGGSVPHPDGSGGCPMRKSRSET